MDREFDFRYIRYIRQIRSLNLKQMETVMQVDSSTISKLEKGQLEFSPLYQSKFKAALQTLNVSVIELNSIQILLEMADKNKEASKQ